MIDFITWVFSLIIPPQELISPIPTEVVALATSIASPTPVVTASPEVLAEITQLQTATPSASATASASPSTTNTPKPTPTASPTSQSTQSPSASPSSTPASANTPTPKPKSTKTPSPTSIPTARPKSQQPTGPEMDAMFTKYSDQYKVDRELLRRIAICESNLNVNSLNKKYGYGGLYQFSEGSWKGYRRVMGQDPNPDLRFDPDQAIKTAAWMLSTGRQSAWPNCK